MRGARVLDVGTGSGILAIAARALGARWAVGFDIDLEAVFVARQTIAVQPAAQAVGLYAGPAEALRGRPAFDLILANMIPAQLVPVLPRLLPLLAPGGRLVVSGLLADQQTSVESELDRLGLIAERARELGEWVALVCARAGN